MQEVSLGLLRSFLLLAGATCGLGATVLLVLTRLVQLLQVIRDYLNKTYE